MKQIEDLVTVRKVTYNNEITGFLFWSKEAKYMQYISKEVVGSGLVVGDAPVCQVEIKDKGTTFISWTVLKSRKRGNQLLREWDYQKNKEAGLDIFSISFGSAKKVHWKCSEGHEWEATMFSRTNGSDCSTCKNASRTSRAEQYLYWWLRHNIDEVSYHKKIDGGLDVDIYIPSLRIAIEYDGEYYHREGPDKEGAERRYRKKLNICQMNGVYLIHIIEQQNYGTDKLQENEIIHECFHEKWNTNIYELIRDISDLIYKVRGVRISLDRPDDILNRCIVSASKTKYQDSLACLKPEIAKEWCQDLNGVLTPDKVTPASHERAWFRCRMCGHEWETEIKQRGYYGQGCPACYKRSMQARKIRYVHG